MRGLVVISTLFIALWVVQLTANHLRIRGYLLAHILATFCGELFFALKGDPYGQFYYWLYALTTVPILLTAVYIAGRMVETLPAVLRWRYLLVPFSVALVGFFSVPVDTPIRSLLALQAGVLGMAGLQTRGAAELSPNSAPYRTLGTLWIVQSLLFFCYAKGLSVNAPGWNALGEWLPALIVVVGLAKIISQVWPERVIT